MKNLFNKELKLSASILSYLFIAFALMTFIPGYPILVGVFFCCQGMFQTFQSAREANDILYTALLPISKSDVVRARFMFCAFIEGCYFLLAVAATVLRMTVLADAPVYRDSFLMPANLVYLGFVALLFGCFNAIFVGGFFKTAYKIGKPFVCFIITAFLMIAAAEALIHVPGLEALGAQGFEHFGVQRLALLLGCLSYIALTWLSMRVSIRNFAKIDL